jgi:hypothetical protein
MSRLKLIGCAYPHLGVVHPYPPTTLLPMISSVLIASAVIGLLLVVKHHAALRYAEVRLRPRPSDRADELDELAQGLGPLTSDGSRSHGRPAEPAWH